MIRLCSHCASSPCPLRHGESLPLGVLTAASAASFLIIWLQLCQFCSFPAFIISTIAFFALPLYSSEFVGSFNSIRLMNIFLLPVVTILGLVTVGVISSFCGCSGKLLSLIVLIFFTIRCHCSCWIRNPSNSYHRL